MYLNFSGNKRLKIQEDSSSQRMSIVAPQRKILSGFTGLSNLRSLGLMDVTTVSAIPEDTEICRVRTSLSEVNGMPYGIADSLNRRDYLGMVDLVQPYFRGRKDECLFAMFGRSHGYSPNNRVPKFLSENFSKTLVGMLEKLDNNEGVPDALRRVDKNLHRHTATPALQPLAQRLGMHHIEVKVTGPVGGARDGRSRGDNAPHLEAV